MLIQDYKKVYSIRYDMDIERFLVIRKIINDNGVNEALEHRLVSVNDYIKYKYILSDIEMQREIKLNDLLDE